jgi:hypothetical protein
MRRVAALVLALAVAAPASAQEPAQTPPAPASTRRDQQPSSGEAPLDPTKLGVSLDRIQRRLVAAADAAEKSETDNPLRIEFLVQVYGTAPRIDVIQDFDLIHGPVPGTAPTHQDMLNYWTPQIFSAPAMPFSTALFWVADQLRKKSQKAACEEELREYRALLMQGVNVRAPRCATQ